MEIINKYRELKPKYERLSVNTRLALVQFLDEHEISSFDVQSRVKSEESFLEKISRKFYSDPFEDVEDVAGVRVICYYGEDLQRIDRIIKEQFKVVSSSNKSMEQDADRFGYASNHYVVCLLDSWLEAPSFRGLKGIKVEIQVRTILMHAWAAISHKLLYKSEDDAPKEFKRKLNRLSALIELADEQFDDIKNMKVEYQDSFVLTSDTPINSDSVFALINKYFPERADKQSNISDVLDELRDYSGSLSDFERRIKATLPFLDDLEHEEHPEMTEPVWGVSGVIRTILDLTSDEYWSQRSFPNFIDETTNKYRAKAELKKFRASN